MTAYQTIKSAIYQCDLALYAYDRALTYAKRRRDSAEVTQLETAITATIKRQLDLYDELQTLAKPINVAG